MVCVSRAKRCGKIELTRNCLKRIVGRSQLLHQTDAVDDYGRLHLSHNPN